MKPPLPALNEKPDAPPFGSLENPIQTEGVDGQFDYLHRLRTESGVPFLWHRLGSCCPPGGEHCVDVYELVATNDSERWVLAVSLYGSKASDRAPGGLKLAERGPRSGIFTGVNFFVENFPAELPDALAYDDFLTGMEVRMILEKISPKAWRKQTINKVLANTRFIPSRQGPQRK